MEIDMKLTIIGMGRVGRAFAQLCRDTHILFQHFDRVGEYTSADDDFLFLAIPDDAVRRFLISDADKNRSIIHFAASISVENAVLLHPYASIHAESDLTQILFTLWGKKNNKLEDLLKTLGVSFFYGGEELNPLYHASAVFAGNFTQMLHEVGRSLLVEQGIAPDMATLLIKQLVATSSDTIGRGVDGFTGPVARGDRETIEVEHIQLQQRHPELAELFNRMVTVTKKGLKDGNILH